MANVNRADLGFQSTPANKPAGDRRGLRWSSTCAVSIHARQQTSGRRLMYRMSSPDDSLFQSTPANKPAGDKPVRRAAAAPGGFNPRPPTNQRATRCHGACRRRGRCFNPRPPTNQRATNHSALGQGREAVSIHARQQTSGRPPPPPRSPRPTTRFNPRPPTNQRATLQTCLDRHQRDVSIHARQQTSGRLKSRLDGLRPVLVSIHARQQTSGRLKSRLDGLRPVLVSIHARQQTSGRQFVAMSAAEYDVFQSTPANKPAGDWPMPRSTGLCVGFNPRPPTNQRATSFRPPTFSRQVLFQSTPANKPAGDGCRSRRQPGRRSFNPRPPTNQRATSRAGCWAVATGFQSTPANKPAGDAT